MPQRNVFICHASLDYEYVNDLKRHVVPVLKTQLSDLRLWESGSLFAGQPWSDQIRVEIENSVAAIVVVSEHLLNSEYAMQEEMPRLLARAQPGVFEILCFYVRPCLADEYIFKVSTNGATRDVVLTDYQWLNPPHKPIASIFHKRNREFATVDAARRLLGTLKGIGTRPPLQLVSSHE